MSGHGEAGLSQGQEHLLQALGRLRQEMDRMVANNQDLRDQVTSLHAKIESMQDIPQETSSLATRITHLVAGSNDLEMRVRDLEDKLNWCSYQLEELKASSTAEETKEGRETASATQKSPQERIRERIKRGGIMERSTSPRAFFLATGMLLVLIGLANVIGLVFLLVAGMDYVAQPWVWAILVIGLILILLFIAGNPNPRAEERSTQ